MANILYQSGVVNLLTAATTWVAGTWKVLLERSTSTYTPNKDDDSLLDKAGFVEVSVASYVRQTVGSPTVTAVDGSDLVSIDCADVSFGTLETGQTVKAIIVYRDDGANGIPLVRIDTDTGGLLPRALGGGTFAVTINTAGLITVAQA